MKKSMIKVISLLLCIVLVALGFASCSGETNKENEKLKIGVIQYGSHPSLDNCNAGVEAGLEASAYAGKYKIDHQDGNFDPATCDTIAKNMVAKNYDMIIAIATPAAVSAYAAVAGTTIPVIFCAVSDPVTAKIVESMDVPGTNCTGTSDILDFAAQLQLIKALQPDVKSIGVLYTTSEANSISQLRELKSAAKDFGIDIVDQGIQAAADVPQAAASLASKVDCINNFTDNTVVSALAQLVEQAANAGIPVYGSEVEQVKNGCLASISIDYVALGKVTADMAVQVLDGKPASEIPVGRIADGTPVINTDVVSQFKLTVPADYTNAEMVKTGKD